ELEADRAGAAGVEAQGRAEARLGLRRAESGDVEAGRRPPADARPQLVGGRVAEDGEEGGGGEEPRRREVGAEELDPPGAAPPRDRGVGVADARIDQVPGDAAGGIEPGERRYPGVEPDLAVVESALGAPLEEGDAGGPVV